MSRAALKRLKKKLKTRKANAFHLLRACILIMESTIPSEEVKPKTADCTLCGEELESNKILHMHSTNPQWPCTNVCIGCLNRMTQYAIQAKMLDVDEV